LKSNNSVIYDSDGAFYVYDQEKLKDAPEFILDEILEK